jgi:predicted transcriptional regulator
MSSEELVLEIKKVHAALKALEVGVDVVAIAEKFQPAITLKDAFKKNEVICLVCGKGKMKTLTRHLNMVHNLKPGEYRKQFGISSKQSLTAKSLSEARRKVAEERGLAENLVTAREIRVSKLKGKKSVHVKAAKPMVAKNDAPDKAAKTKVKQTRTEGSYES